MKENSNREECRRLKFQLLGWILFIVCALCYLASSLKSQDPLAITGSIAFLVACIVFLVPLVDTWKSRNSSRRGS